jgi:uncharacterized surface protein with fasciclin (FAS1) repeats
MRWILAAACAAGLVMGSAAMLSSSRALAGDQKMQQTSSMDIIETATGPGMQQVTTVVTAIQAAGLVDTLKGKGPFTVFAPTNAAFEKLPPGTVESLLKPENKEKLTAILTYHVHAGDAIRAADVKTMNLSTVNGKPLMVKLDGSNVWINNARVIKTDVICSNGVIHWIDTVLIPQ